MIAKQKAVWLFAGGQMQESAARRVKEEGYALILTDRAGDCVCTKYCDAFVELDTFDIKGNRAAAQKLSRQFDIKAVFTAAADCHETVAWVGSDLGLPAMDPAISRICRNKEKTRVLLENAGIPVPRFRSVDSLYEAERFIRELGRPVVLKATDSSGSRWFSLVQTVDDLDQEKLVMALSAGTTGQVLVEEMLNPTEDEIAEQSVETVWYDGRMYWLNWVDRLFRKELRLFPMVDSIKAADVAWGVELGHINPAVHHLET